MKRSDRGQSTLEYVIIVAAVIGAIVVVAATFLRPKLETSYDGLTTKMENKIGTVSFGGS